MNITGLDLSLTATGIAYDGELGVIKPKSTGVDRLIVIRAMLRGHIGRHVPKLVVIEGYAFGKHDSGARSIGELGGVVRTELCDYNIPFVEVPPATLKKFATGRGNASKDEVLAAAVRHERRISDNNMADAWWLYQMGLSWYVPDKRVPTLKLGAVRQSVLKVINWPDLKATA